MKTLALPLLLLLLIAHHTHTRRTQALAWHQAHSPARILGQTPDQIRATFGRGAGDLDAANTPNLIYTNFETDQQCFIRFQDGVAVSVSVSPCDLSRTARANRKRQ